MKYCIIVGCSLQVKILYFGGNKMQNLKVIENELVPVYETSTGEKVVYGSELHVVLEVKSRYREWIDRRFTDCEAVENEDFQVAEFSAPSGQVKKDHIIKLDTAKEMAMLERNEKGKQVRRYFIQIEKRYKEQKKQLTVSEQIKIIAQGNIQLEQKIDDVKQDLEDFKMDMPILGIEIDKITEAVHKRGVHALGGKDTNAYKNKSLRSKVYQDIYRELKRQFGVTTYKAIKRNQCEQAVAVIDDYELPIVLQEEVKNCNAQINMEVA